MILEYLILDGYGQFVWPAFIFAFVSCVALYLKTKKELQNQEKLFFSKYGKLQTSKINISEEEKIIKKALSAGSV
tara:strand:+ start:1835 stop:2059 length:225 start_codon:yes stop_codon:yes gene_type:complete